MTKNEIKAAFAACTTVESVKEAFVRLYPGLRSNQMEACYAEYEKAYKKAGTRHEDAYGKVYKGETIMPANIFGGLAGAVYDYCKGVKLSQRGQVLIASGRTFPNKEMLTRLGFKWDGKSRTWKYYTCSADKLAVSLPITFATLTALADA